MIRIKSSSQKKALHLKQEPGLAEELKEDPDWTPRSIRLFRSKRAISRVTKRSQTPHSRVMKSSQSTPAPNAKRESSAFGPPTTKKRGSSGVSKAPKKTADDIEVVLKDNITFHELSLYIEPTAGVGKLMEFWQSHRPRTWVSEPRFMFNGERLVEGATVREVR